MDDFVLSKKFNYSFRDVLTTWRSLMQNNSSLRILNLQNCELGDTTCEYIFEGLIQNTCLEHLNLKNNEIEDQSILKQLLPLIVKNKSLKYLDLSCNRISDFSGQKIAVALKHN